MKKINTALFCIFVLLFCSCDVLNKAPLDEIADDSFWSDETLVKYYVNDLYINMRIPLNHKVFFYISIHQ